MSTVFEFLFTFALIAFVAWAIRWGWQQDAMGDEARIRKAMKHVDDFIHEVLGSNERGNGNGK